MSSHGGDAVLQQEDRLVPDGAEDPVGDEAGDLPVEHHRYLAQPASELDRGRDRLVGGVRSADHLDAFHHQRRVEEMQVADPVRSRRSRRRCATRRCWRSWWPGSRAAGRGGPGRRTSCRFTSSFSTAASMTKSARGGRSGQVGAERQSPERGVDLLRGAAALLDVSGHPLPQLAFRPVERVWPDVGDGRVEYRPGRRASRSANPSRRHPRRRCSGPDRCVCLRISRLACHRPWKTGRRFGQEGVGALGLVVGGVEQGLGEAFDDQAGALVGVHPGPDHQLGQPHRERSLGHDLPGDLPGLVEQIRLRAPPR